jgi:hypothetical protein
VNGFSIELLGVFGVGLILGAAFFGIAWKVYGLVWKKRLLVLLAPMIIVVAAIIVALLLVPTGSVSWIVIPACFVGIGLGLGTGFRGHRDRRTGQGSQAAR